jgi:hypothetical protein
MTGYLMTVRTDNSIQIIEVSTATILNQLQAIVGGYIETVPGWDTIVDPTDPNKRIPCAAFCNEEGKLKGLSLNFGATMLWMESTGQNKMNDALVGNVVVVYGDREFMAAL